MTGALNATRLVRRRGVAQTDGASAVRWQVLGAAALLASAGVHLYLWLDGVRNQSVGPLLLVNVVSGVVIAGLLLRWRHWLPAFLTLGFGATTLGAFVISATVGLLGVHTSLEGFYAFAAAVAEVVCIVVGAVLLSRQRDLVMGVFRHPGRHAG
jgi:hypothetical protein